MRKKAEIRIDLGKRLPVKQKRERREEGERNRLFFSQGISHSLAANVYKSVGQRGKDYDVSVLSPERESPNIT